MKTTQFRPSTGLLFSAACSSRPHSNKLSRAQTAVDAEEIDESSSGICGCSATSSSVFSRPAKVRVAVTCSFPLSCVHRQNVLGGRFQSCSACLHVFRRIGVGTASAEQDVSHTLRSAGTRCVEDPPAACATFGFVGCFRSGDTGGCCESPRTSLRITCSAPCRLCGDVFVFLLGILFPFHVQASPLSTSCLVRRPYKLCWCVLRSAREVRNCTLS